MFINSPRDTTRAVPINYNPAATVVGTKLTIASHVSAWTHPRQAGQYS